jgi:nicotinamide phosphoribosyltransferase
VFGVGAFCFSVVFENDRMIINTRDMFGCACKATFGIIDGKELFIFKDPKTDTSKLKKSHKGLIFVEKTDDGFIATDGFDKKGFELYSREHENAMHLVYCDGRLYNEECFTTIRERLANEK